MEYYIVVLVAVLITVASQINITVTYSKYKKVKTKKGKSGFEVASEILKANDLEEVYVVETKGELTDHYDPTRKVVRLSESNYHTDSVSAISVAAHEVGHALQDKEGYWLLRLRAKMVPIVNFSSKMGYFAILIGFLFDTRFIWLGIWLQVAILLFQLVTLPVEFDASKRALIELEKLNLIDKKENNGAKKVLGAAALTYVASVATTLLEMLRLIMIAKGRDD